MPRYLLFTLLFGGSLTHAPAQQLVRYVELTPPAIKVRGSLYRHLEFMDSRPDTTLIGPIQIGDLNNIDARLRFRTPGILQCQRLIDSLVDSTAKDGTLLLQLRDLSFVEPIRIRYVFVKATLYARDGNGYRKLSTLDRTDVLDGYQVAPNLNNLWNKQLDSWIAAALTRAPTDTVVYSLREVARMDSIDVHSLPLYTAGSFTDGIYRHYSSFSKQLPDKQGMIKAKKDGTITAVHVFDDSMRTVKLKPRDIYAIVYKGKPYAATEYGFYPLERVRDNFFFTGDIRVGAIAGDVIFGYVFTGLVGIFVASRGYEERYDLLIDPLSGIFVHLRRIETPQTP